MRAGLRIWPGFMALALIAGCGGIKQAPPPHGHVDPAAVAAAEGKWTQAKTPAAQQAVAGEAAEAAKKAGDYPGAVRWRMRARQVEHDAAAKATLESEIAMLVDHGVDKGDVGALRDEFSGDGFLAEALDFRLASLAAQTGEGSARGLLDTFISRYPASARVQRAKDLLALLDGAAAPLPNRIGVLVPLSGAFRSYGESVLDAVRMAAGEKNQAGALDIVVRDTKSDPAATAQAVRDLVMIERVGAIVGALFRKEAEPAGARAQELGVPLVTLTADPDIPALRPYVFGCGLTHEEEVAALVSYAIDTAKLKNFAMIYPRNAYGEAMQGLFRAAVEARGGQIHGVETYAPEDTTFTAQIRHLVKRDEPGKRADYQKARERCKQQPDSYRKARCEREVRATLEPIIDFDGIFIPDYPGTLALIAPAIAAEDVIVERDPAYVEKIETTIGRKIHPVTLLGGSGWNSPKLPEKAGRYVENAIFSDAFFLGASDEASARFVSTFQSRFGRAPGLPESLFYDATLLVRGVLTAAHPNTREDFREALSRARNSPGATGPLSFADGSNLVHRPVHILTIQNGTIRSLARIPVGGASGNTSVLNVPPSATSRR